MADFHWGPGVLKVARDGRTVKIEIQCPSEYHAIMVYDSALRDASRGTIALSLDTEMPVETS